jgi:hypothetical protein
MAEGRKFIIQANGNGPTIPNPESGTYCVQLASGTGATVGCSISQSFNVQAGVSYSLGVANIRYTLSGRRNRQSD